MATTNPNSCSQPMTDVFEKIERFTTNSGRVIEVKFTKTTIFDGYNKKKQEVLEWPEGFTDSRKIDDLSEARNCCVCDGLYHKESSNNQPCRFCGKYYCENCSDKVIDKDTKEEISACKHCAEERNAGIVKKAWQKIWKLNK